MPREEFDVVVVGMGNAAQSSAAAAREQGARVLLIEKAPQPKRGGNTWFSQSAQFRFYHSGVDDVRPLLPNVPPNQLDRCDIPSYSKDDFYSDLMRVTQGRADPELTEMLVEKSQPTVRWMRSMGIGFDLLSSQAVPVGDRLKWHHGENCVYSMDGGAGLVAMWAQVNERLGVEIRYDSPLVRLLTDDRARVTGLVVQGDQGYYEVGAKAVILGCGGYESSPEMRARYLGPGWDLARVRGTRYNTGEGIQMALDIGAQAAGHYSSGHATPIDAATGDYEAGFLDPVKRLHMSHRYGWPLGIMVNTNGQRFVDEGEDFSTYTYAKFGAEILKQPGGIAYQVFDAKTAPLLPQHMYGGATPTIASTLEELAEKLEVNRDGFLSMMESFNQAVVEDREFDRIVRDGRHTQGIRPPKSNWAQRIDAPPFTAYAAACGLTFTYGGLKINTDCQVLGQHDRPIPGLYGCGELTAGFFYFNYPGGAGMMRGAVTGSTAGRHAASL